MKKIVFLSSLICFALIINSCDYVSNVVEGSSNGGGGNNDTTKIYRKVLIEDYTGHKCGNCPAAAEDLHRIDSIYHDKVIPLAIHAGGFANTNGSYPTDLKSAEGTTWDQIFGISANGNPNGLVNRSNFGTSNFILGWTLWETAATPYMTQEADFKIEINNTFNAGTSQVNSEVKVTANKAVSGKFNVTVILVEDSIIAEQLDYSLPAGQQLIPDYLFMHVMRGSLNSAWGEQILDGSLAKGVSVTKTYSNYSIASPIVPAHCHIIALVYNADNTSASYYEVMQVEQADVMP